MAGKVKISQEFMDRVMAGTMSGPDAMKAEELTREDAALRRATMRFGKKIDAANLERAKVQEELKALLGEEPAE